MAAHDGATASCIVVFQLDAIHGVAVEVKLRHL
jgi:hypothetical protein